LTPLERLRFSWALYEMFGAAEFMYLQFRQNALPAAVWGRWEATLVWWLSPPGMAAWWVARPAPFAEGFEVFATRILRERRMDPAVLARWQGFVAGQGLSSVEEPLVVTQ
jgi:hypothetical protein